MSSSTDTDSDWWPSSRKLGELYETSAKQDSLYCRGNFDADPTIFYKVCKLDFELSSIMDQERGFFGAREFALECKHTIMAGDAEIGPRVYTANIQVDKDEMYGSIQMDRLYMSLGDFFDQTRDFFYAKEDSYEADDEDEINVKLVFVRDVLRSLLKEMTHHIRIMWNTCNFIHMDLHSHNIYIADASFKSIKMIDFGRCIPRNAFQHLPVQSDAHYHMSTPKTFQTPQEALEQSTKKLKRDLIEFVADIPRTRTSNELNTELVELVDSIIKAVQRIP